MTELLPVDRLEITARVMKTLPRLRTMGDIFPVRREDGTAPIIVALLEDCVGDVNTRVTDYGGRANVVVAEHDGFTIWAWDVDGMESMDAVDVHHDTTIGMIRIWLEQRPESMASFNVLTRAASAKELAYQS